MEYYNNKALELILKYQKATNENIVTLNDNQKYINENLIEFINVFKGFIDELKEENKLIREDLKQIKSVFNLDKESTKDEVIPSPPKEYQEMLCLLNTPLCDMKISGRSYWCLKFAKVRNIANLIKYDKRDLMRLRNFGKTSYLDVINYLEKNNLTLGMDISKYEPYLESTTK
tara:strand:- start:42 stop:560 length:519 start_codon:yes stop_codon:yes gene_type:complete